MKRVSKTRGFFVNGLRGLLYVLAVVIYFSYFPVMTLGKSEAMNFELSLPLLWLVVFDVFAVAMLVHETLFIGVVKKWVIKRWMWLMFPVFVSLSVIWSLNVVRGVLTVGAMWAVVIAVVSCWELRGFLDDKFKRQWIRVFLTAGVLVCFFCILQCILDVLGVGREWTLLCEGCTYMSFGFPHPNGFAIEPQFMGNLLLAPLVCIGWLMFRSWPRPSGPSPRADGANPRAAALRDAISLKHLAILFCIVGTTLFLTFSRGAIYAFVVAAVFMTAMAMRQSKRILMIWPMVILSFLLALNFQGILAAVSPTDDTYFTGITKALNHLSLGVVDVRAMSAEFDGYVAESTEIRKQMSQNGLAVWRESPKNMLVGVGIGGAGEAMYEAGLTGSPKEIIQNEYVSLLTETGLLGIVLLLITVGFISVSAKKYLELTKSKEFLPIVTLAVAYGVTLMFFSGMANALQIYLLPVVLMVVLDNKTLRKM